MITAEPDTPQPCLAFALLGRRWALPASQVESVAVARHITPLPSPHPDHLGLVVHRDRALPLVDLRRLLGGIPQDLPLAGTLQLCIITHTGLALPVDEVFDLTPRPEGVVTHRLLHLEVLELPGEAEPAH